MEKSIESKIIAILLTLSVFGPVSAQKIINDDSEKQHSFIKYGADTLAYDRNSTTMRAFFDKFGKVLSTKKGKVNIMHIGGSHVQAGTFSHRLRMNLLNNFTGLTADRGMIFPYSVGKKCNNPADYRVSKSNTLELCRNVYKNPERELGLCGIAVTACDSTEWIKIRMNEHGTDFATNEITILGYSSVGNVVPYLDFAGHHVQPTRVNPDTRRYTYKLPVAVDSFKIVIPCHSGDSFTLTGIYLGNGKPGISLSSIGVNGAAVPDYLKCPYFCRDLQLVEPDLVIFGIGINDAAGPNFDTVVFRRNYLRLIDSIRSVNPQCAFIFITNNDSYKKTGRHRYSVNRNGALARDVFYRLAKETDGAVWDMFDIMGGLTSMTKWRDAGLGRPDRIHFTPAGYNLMGDMLYKAIIKEISYDDEQPESFFF